MPNLLNGWRFFLLEEEGNCIMKKKELIKKADKISKPFRVKDGKGFRLKNFVIKIFQRLSFKLSTHQYSLFL